MPILASHLQSRFTCTISFIYFLVTCLLTDLFLSHRFYDPYEADINPHSSEDTLNGRLNSDGALDSFAEVAIWRLGGVHSMIRYGKARFRPSTSIRLTCNSIIDGTTQYFIAGARRDKSSPEDDIVNDSWFGCFQVPSQGGLCEVG